MNKMAELGVSIERLKEAIVAGDQLEAARLVDEVDELAAELIRRVNRAQGLAGSLELGSGV